MLAPSCLLESHSCRLSWPGIWVVLAPIISDRKETAVPGGFPTEPRHRESVQYHNRRKHREEIEKKKFWKKRIFKLKLVWTLFCSILCCSFTFSQISDFFLTYFCGSKTYFFFFFFLFLKCFFLVNNHQLTPFPPENNVYQDFFLIWTASEKCFVFLVGYGMCPFGWGTEI